MSRFVTVENALAWATLPAGDANWWAFRMSVVRGFASSLHALDPAHQVPPKDLLPRRVRRLTPYVYSDQEIRALMAASSSLRFELRQETYRTLIGLLSVTGMRIGEAIRLDDHDADLRHGVLTVRETKFGKTRELPLHRSTVARICVCATATNRPGSATRCSSSRSARGCSIATSATRSCSSSSAPG